MKKQHEENITRFIEMCGLVRAKNLKPSEQRVAFEKAVKGTNDDVNAYIIGNTRLVSSAITNLISMRNCSRYLIDDLFSAGLVALTRSVNVVVNKVRQYDDAKFQAILDQWGKDGSELKVAPYLYVAIYREIRVVYEHDSSDPLTKRRRKAILNTGGTLTRRISIPKYVFKIAEDHTLAYAEVLQEILSVAETEQERNVLELRLTHHDVEIAKIIGISPSGVSRLRTKLHKRFCKDHCYAYHR